MDIIKALGWRYATKTFNKDKKLSDEQMDKILEAARLSPSSFGLQPWKFIVVKNPELRAKIREAGWSQPQITDASHLIVFSVVKNVDAAYVDRFTKSVADTRGVTVDALKGYADMMKGAVSGKSTDDVKAWSARQVYIALGVVMTALAAEGIDSCPMEGFDPKKVDEILGLGKLGLESLVILPVGYRANDSEANTTYKKVRFPKNEVVVEVK